MNYDIANLKVEITKEHKEIFPNATKATQALKYLEELIEFNDSQTNEDRLDELCDIFIVGCGMSRFDLKYSKFICEKALAIMEIYFNNETDEVYKENVYNRIVKVWNYKKTREIIEVNPGEYRHLEENK